MEAMAANNNITLAITGASGAVYAREALRLLAADERIANIHLLLSDSALRVLVEELQLAGRAAILPCLLGEHSTIKVRLHGLEDIGASIASGSYPTLGMIVLPCSMGTLASIANGLANRLIERAADVCLKEQRKLILCVRETPFNKIHLRNMSLAADAGAVIFPCIPTLYNRPQNTEEMARQFAMRVLAHFGLQQPGGYVWRAKD